MGTSILMILPLTVIYGVILLLVWMRFKSSWESTKQQLRDFEDKLQMTETKLQEAQREGTHQIAVTNFSKTILDVLEQSIVLTDLGGNILYINNQAEKLIRTSNVEARQHTFKHLFKLTDTHGGPAFAEIETAMQGKSAHTNKWLFISSAGQKLPVFVSAQPVFDENHRLTQVVILLADATLQLETEEEAKAFFSTAAHELRTPLTIIHSSAALLLDTFEQQTKDKLKEIISGINQASIQLIDLVNDFLSVSRIEQGRLDIRKEDIDILAMVKEVITNQSNSAKERKLFLNTESELGSLLVMADPTKVREILTNLVSNGLKYTFQGGVTIKITKNETLVEIRVSDTGVGIPKDEIALLFKKFQQVGEARTQSQTKSTGLGLYISKKLAELMGGDLVLEKSEPGQGTTFLFTLPLVSTSTKIAA